MKQLNEELENAGYKKWAKSPVYQYSEYFYQKKIRDDYYINCIVYNHPDGYEVYTFEAQFTYDDKSINIETVSWYGDPNEKYRPYPTLQEVEEMFDKMYNTYITEKYIGKFAITDTNEVSVIASYTFPWFNLKGIEGDYNIDEIKILSNQEIIDIIKLNNKYN